MNANQRRTLAAVLCCHFAAAFAALGMPPFFAVILSQSFHSGDAYLAGWFYVVPTFFTALASPYWGALADRIGKKVSLLRAQLGLAAGFLLAGYSSSSGGFFLALALQGLLGGTFAASNAYLATLFGGPELVRGLTWMQGSARAALVLAPVLLGRCAATVPPLELYRYLALLPLAAALLLWALPDGSTLHPSGQGSARPGGGPAPLTAGRVYALQFAFVFATVATFPYFVPYAQAVAELSLDQAGLWFGVPNLLYLVLAGPLAVRYGQRLSPLAVAGVFLAMAAALGGQALAGSLAELAPWRVLMGLALTGGFIALHAWVAAMVHAGNAGRTFGWLESGSKWGAVAAGLAAGAVAQGYGPRAPFWLGAATMAAAAGWLAAMGLRRRGVETM